MTIEKAKVILGKNYKNYTDDEISEMISLFEVLADVTVSNMRNKILGINLKKDVK